uniref:5'-(N(7)-methylguanosine 5'-triphospho)-[mRNA] hydrolase n=1 Tax=Leptobrachium leishanense TaxID=445787 RepID=A0A8C5R516_9ANUR
MEGRAEPFSGRNVLIAVRGAGRRFTVTHRSLYTGKMEARGRAGHEMSLAALRHRDPFISSIVDVTGQVALYSFSPRTGEWEKTNIEGTLFVYTRSASPHHGFTIMNRLNMNNLVEPVNKDLEFQLHEPFLLYRNASLSIYSIWFYDKNDCQRIAKLMMEVVQLESERTKTRASPHADAGAERSIDILEMLSKAKNDYEKVRGREENLTLCGHLTIGEARGSHISASFQAGQRHLTVEELFGTSVGKEQPASAFPNPETNELLPDKGGHGVYLPFTSEHSKAFQPLVIKSEPAAFSCSATECGHSVCTAPILMPQLPVSHSDCHKMQTFPLRLSPSLCSTPSDVLSKSAPLSSGSTACIRHVLPNLGRQLSPLMIQPLSDLSSSAQNPPLLAPCVPVGLPKVSGTDHTDAELLQKLKSHNEHMQSQPISKAGMAPKFSCAGNQLATPESFKGNAMKTVNSLCVAPVQREPDSFAQPVSLSKVVTASQFVTPTTSAASSSILLSPSVFEQSVQKSSKAEDKTRVSPPTQASTDLPMFVLSRSQLQETLVHLIKVTDPYCDALYERELTKNHLKVGSAGVNNFIIFKRGEKPST